MARVFCLSLLLAAALLPSGCASTDEEADDQMNAFHSTTPASSEDDSHGWGANIGAVGKQ